MHKEKNIVKKGVRTFKFGDGNKLNSLYKVTLPCVIGDIEVSIVTDVVDTDIPLLLSRLHEKNRDLSQLWEWQCYDV